MAVDEEHYQTVLGQIRRGIWQRIAPLVRAIEATDHIPYDQLFPILRDLNVFGLLIPQAYGGSGLSATEYWPIIAEFAKVHGGIRVLVHAHVMMSYALSRMGNSDQRAAVLPGAATGELSVAFALTEPDHGTGADIGTTAQRSGDDYILNGEKWLITNADFASHFIVFAKTSAKSVSALLVPRETPGLSITPLPPTMGCVGGQHCHVRFTAARVPASALLGREGEGLALMENTMLVSRVYIAAAALGTAEYALALSLDYAKQRETFGKPIAERQAVQRYLAEMATDVYALRQIVTDVAARIDRGDSALAESSMCKLFAGDVVARVTDRALLVHGGIGYTRAHPIERLYRDARLNWLEEGTPTIHYLVTAREYLSDYGRDEWDPSWHERAAATTDGGARMYSREC